MTQIGAALPDAQFGLAEVRDYGGSIYDEENPEDVPWRLDVPVTTNTSAVTDAIGGLYASGGGDGPEAYGRALWETDTNPTVGWRAGARHLIVLVADNVPHDNDLDEGIPQSVWVEESPWDTGEELLEPDGIPGTQLTSTTNLDWQSVLSQLAADQKPLEFVDYHGESGYLPYWENWAARTGGEAVAANAGQLVSELVGLAEAGANEPAPPPPAPMTSCARYTVIDSRGSGETKMDHGHRVIETSPPGASFLARLKARTKDSITLIKNPYAAVSIFGKNWRELLNGAGAVIHAEKVGAYHDSVVEGKKLLAAKLSSIANDPNCPGSKIFLVGYSQGAQVTGDVYEAISHDKADTGILKHIRGVALFGDPYFNNDDHRADRGNDIGFGGGLLGHRPPFSGPVLSYCHKFDPFCDWPLSPAALALHWIKEHENYPPDAEAAAEYFSRHG